MGGVDIAKLICCIGITIVHCFNFGTWQEGYGWYVMSFCVSIGVAYFFVASGYFLKQNIKKNGQTWSVIKKYCVRLLWPLIFWDIVNVSIEIINIYRNHMNLWQEIRKIIGELLFHPRGAMWYIQALIIGVLLWGWFIEHKKVGTGIVIGIILYGIGSFANSYNYIIKETTFENLVNGYINIFNTSRNGVFMGFALVGLGIYIADKGFHVVKENRKKYIVLSALAFVMLTCEIIMCKYKGWIDNHSMFYSILILAPMLFLLASSVKTERKKFYMVARKLSAGIYYSHVPMIVIVMSFYRVINLNVSYGLLLWVTDLIMCITLCFGAMKVDKKFINKVMF